MDFITDSAFLCAFSHNPMTFATDHRVVGSVTGWAPVEHPHKADSFPACDQGHDSYCQNLSDKYVSFIYQNLYMSILIGKTMIIELTYCVYILSNNIL